MSRVRSARPAADRCRSPSKPSTRCKQRQTGEGMAANAETPVPGEPAELGRQGSAGGDVPARDAGSLEPRPRRERRPSRCRTGWCGSAASLLLAYPDERQAQRLDTVDRAAGPRRRAGCASYWADRRAPCGQAAPMQRGGRIRRDVRPAAPHTMYLTYWTAGDTRNRGREMHAFAAAYRDAGVDRPTTRPPTTFRWCSSSPRPSTRRRGGGCWSSTGCRSTFCARPDRSGRPMRTPSPPCAETLPAATDQDARRAQRLAQSGPPTEAVGLQPFTLTVPPRRREGGR